MSDRCRHVPILMTRCCKRAVKQCITSLMTVSADVNRIQHASLALGIGMRNNCRHKIGQFSQIRNIRKPFTSTTTKDDLPFPRAQAQPTYYVNW